MEGKCEAEKKKHRCCFTGHRPEKIGVSEQTVVKALENEIRQAIDDGFNVFITGMAQGTDIWAAEIIIHLRKTEGIPLKLIAASPFDGFEQRWSIDWQKKICCCYGRGRSNSLYFITLSPRLFSSSQ